MKLKVLKQHVAIKIIIIINFSKNVIYFFVFRKGYISGVFIGKRVLWTFLYFRYLL